MQPSTGTFSDQVAPLIVPLFPDTKSATKDPEPSLKFQYEVILFSFPVKSEKR